MNGADWSLSKKLFRSERKSIDASVRAVLVELVRENTLVPDTPGRLFERLLMIYRGIRPLFVFFLELPVVPPTWREVLEALVRVLDALDSPEIVARFKAGRDL